VVLTPEQEKWLRTNRNLAGMRGPAPSTQTDSDDDDDDGYDDGGGLLAKGPDGPGGLPDIGWALAGGKRGPTAAAKSALLKKLLEKGIKVLKFAGGKVFKLLDLADKLDQIGPELWHRMKVALKAAHEDIKEGVVYLGDIARPALQHIADTTGDIVSEDERHANNYVLRWAKAVLPEPSTSSKITVEKPQGDVAYVGPLDKESDDRFFDYAPTRRLAITLPLTAEGGAGPALRASLVLHWQFNKKYIRNFSPDIETGADVPPNYTVKFVLTPQMGRASGDIATIDLCVHIEVANTPIRKTLWARIGGNGVGEWR